MMQNMSRVSHCIDNSSIGDKYTTTESLSKSMYFATMAITKKWTSPAQNWGCTLAQLTIYFEGRIED